MREVASRCLPITDREADQRFRARASELSLHPDGRWVGGYVDYEWQHVRYLLESDLWSVSGKVVLEFGCNVGATAVVLAALGARVTAIDINPASLELAKLNAERYGLESAITFLHLADAGGLPFDDGVFEVVCCNSVLEYVQPRLWRAVLRDIDRVLAPRGIVAVFGTSNRLWPREAHSKRWLINYIPRQLWPGQRGVSPWRIRSSFAGYEDLHLMDGGRSFLESKRRMGTSPGQLRLITVASRWLRPLGVSIGMLMPNCCLVLRKRQPAPPCKPSAATGV